MGWILPEIQTSFTVRGDPAWTPDSAALCVVGRANSRIGHTQDHVHCLSEMRLKRREVREFENPFSEFSN